MSLIQRWEVVELLGSGGMATVHLAHLTGGPARDRYIAVKRLHAFVAEDPESIERLRDEARIASLVRHPNVVGAIGVVEDAQGGSPALLLEWIDGIDLAKIRDELAARGRRLPLDVAVAIVRDVLAGLQAIHEATHDGEALRIVHRDVSPQNVLVGCDGRARIADFGAATGSWRDADEDAITGNLGYMAPEQLAGRGDLRADLFAAGAVLWELVTGKRFRDVDRWGFDLIVRILRGEIMPPSHECEDARVFDDVLLHALRRDPGERMESARAMASAIVAAVTPAAPERVARLVRDLLGRTNMERHEQCRAA